MKALPFRLNDVFSDYFQKIAGLSFYVFEDTATFFI